MSRTSRSLRSGGIMAFEPADSQGGASLEAPQHNVTYTCHLMGGCRVSCATTMPANNFLVDSGVRWASRAVLQRHEQRRLLGKLCTGCHAMTI